MGRHVVPLEEWNEIVGRIDAHRTPQLEGTAVILFGNDKHYYLNRVVMAELFRRGRLPIWLAAWTLEHLPEIAVESGRRSGSGMA